MGKIRHYTGKKSVSIEVNGKEFCIEAFYKCYSDEGSGRNCSNDYAYPPEGDESEISRTYDADGVEMTEEAFKAAIMEAMEAEMDKAELREDDGI